MLVPWDETLKDSILHIPKSSYFQVSAGRLLGSGKDMFLPSNVFWGLLLFFLSPSSEESGMAMAGDGMRQCSEVPPNILSLRCLTGGSCSDAQWLIKHHT